MPEPLPAGERLLWQGAPDWRTLARRAFHIRKLALYFAVLLSWVTAEAVLDGDGPLGVLATFGKAAGAGVAVLAIVAAYAWAVARGSRYTVTDRRVVIRIGLALPVTINLPFARIDGAAARVHADGGGDVSLALRGRDRLAYAILWPHARPWQFARAQPTMRGVRNADAVAQVLARALAASADMPVPSLATPGLATPGLATPVLRGDVAAGAAVPHSPVPA